jgi:hypothetical protein
MMTLFDVGYMPLFFDDSSSYSVPYRVVDESGNPAEYGKLLETNESKYNPDAVDGIEWYKVLNVDALKGIIEVADNDEGLEDILSRNEVSQIFAANMSDAMLYISNWINEALEEISQNNKFNYDVLDNTILYIVAPDDEGNYNKVECELRSWGEREFVCYDYMDNIKVAGSWEISDGKLELNFDKDYYGDGDMNEEFEIKEVNKKEGYITIYDGDYDDYIFFDKIKAQNFLNNINSH